VDTPLVNRQYPFGSVEVHYNEKEGVSGRYIVIATSNNGDIKARLFENETAWSDAERYANDCLHKILKDAGRDFDYTQNISL